MESYASTDGFLTRALALIGISTFILTASFIGILAILSRSPTGLTSRVPFYLIVMGLAFVATILVLEEYGTMGRVVIVTAGVISLITFVATTLTVEGIMFAASQPASVFGRQLVFYFIAAALIGTGIGYWAIQHWREFAAQPGGGI